MHDCSASRKDPKVVSMAVRWCQQKPQECGFLVRLDSEDPFEHGCVRGSKQSCAEVIIAP